MVVHDDPQPTTTRHGMAFGDAVFDGHAVLDGVRAVRADTMEQVEQALDRRDAVPVYVRRWRPLLAMLDHHVLVDARMRKRAIPEVQIGYADLTIGLGPALVVGRHAHVVVETSWDGLGAVITGGASLPLTGEPAPSAGTLATATSTPRSTAFFARRRESPMLSAKARRSPRSTPR